MFAVACTSALGDRDNGASPAAQTQRAPVIDHIAPARDSVGATPSRFQWTAIEGAERYAIVVFNEVDAELWRRDDVRETSVNWPDDVTAEPGTYFWAVVALREGRPIAESGRSAFVVTAH